ncbi:MAG: ribonuclease HII [bacterium]
MDLSERSLRELREIIETLEEGERSELISRLVGDRRKGARALVRRLEREEEEARQREARWRAFCDPERRLTEKGYLRVAGVDEAGRGPLAGPVVAAAVVLPPEFVHHPLDDSKRMSPAAREAAYDAVTAAALGWSVGEATAAEIDRHNILGATHLAIDRSLAGLDPVPDFALVDGRPLTACAVPHKALVKGDRRSRVIAAASVIAKVTRDRMMEGLEEEYPGWGFSEHKGYATRAHLEILAARGPSPVHRRTFGEDARQLELLSCDRDSPHLWGRQAEDLVSVDYSSRGYEVVHRNWRGGGGELDIVCSGEGTWVFIEVKAARGEWAGAPLEWLGPEQRMRWRRAAAAFLRQEGRRGGTRELRFDLVGVIDREEGPPEMVRLEGVEP